MSWPWWLRPAPDRIGLAATLPNEAQFPADPVVRLVAALMTPAHGVAVSPAWLAAEIRAPD